MQTSSTEDGEEKVHISVQCKHGFSLISGERDFSLKPACFEKACIAEGRRWLQMEGVLDPKRNGEIFEATVGAINAACANLPPMPLTTKAEAPPPLLMQERR